MTRKRTGILTLSSAENYGAVLQCHSLCKYLNDNYSDTEIIDFTPRFIVGRYPLFHLKYTSLLGTIKSAIGSILEFPAKMTKRIRFIHFRRVDSKYGSQKYIGVMLDESYDQYIVGSDQVFNLELTGNDCEFFLPRVKHNKSTYAASLGVSTLNDEQADLLSKGLADFDNISIREKVGCGLLRSIIQNKDVTQLIDPVFLNSREYWEQLSGGRIYKKKYILIYAFQEFETSYEIATLIKHDSQYDIIMINDSIKRKRKDVLNIKGIGPKEFLSLIKNAECVITDSFHGTAFSMIFRKKFYSIPYRGTESRFFDMLELFELEDRIISNTHNFVDLEVDYSSYEKNLSFQQERIMNYFNCIYYA